MQDNLTNHLFPFQENVVVFGDLHLNYDALEVILEEARKENIDTALNLGDEDSFGGGLPEYYDKLFGALREYRDEKKERRLICIIGDKTWGVKPDLKRNYVGVDSKGRIKGSVIFREGNVIAGHNAEWIFKEYADFIKNYSGSEPLVIFHGHSHSMGVLPEFKWLEQDEFIHFLSEGRREFQLEPRKVYWINPGAPYPYANLNERIGAANFALYYPKEQKVILRTEFYELKD